MPTTEIERLEQELRQHEQEIAILTSKLERLKNERNDLLECSSEARVIADHMDDWIHLKPKLKRDHPCSLLFLGACSGEWAARCLYNGKLPGFGGFLMVLRDEDEQDTIQLLIDPGRSTLSEMQKQDIYPKHLDAVLVTHAHWDCTHDLEQVIMAACPASMESPDLESGKLHLYGDRSVLFGLPMNTGDVVEGMSKLMETGQEPSGNLKKRLSRFPMQSPGAVNVYDLFVRLQGRYTTLEIGKTYDVSKNIRLFTRRSYHPIRFGINELPGLDFVMYQGGKPGIRCVYLSDTEYRPELVDQYVDTVNTLGRIDVLILNVKTLDLFQYQDGPYQGFTRKHLGWKGAVTLTNRLNEAGVLSPDSLVVLRAWGIETVTRLDEGPDAAQDEKKYGRLVAQPDKLEIYEKHFTTQTGQPCLIPYITWVHVDKTREKPIQVDHKIRPYHPVGQARSFGEVYYTGPKMTHLIDQLQAVIGSNETLIIHGESGAGKDILARAIHDEAQRAGKREGNYVWVQGGTLSKELSRSELAGHEKGSFTGASETTAGYFEEAKGGTLVIEDFLNMSPEVQKQFLSVLEHREYAPMGKNEKVKLEVQLILTTNEDIHQAIAEGRFREDLYNRAMRRYRVPPLRERKDDIPAIIDAWRREGGTDEFTEGWSNIPFDIDPEAMTALVEYDWPGNVRQLKNVVRRLVDANDWSAENIKWVLSDHVKATNGKRETMHLNALEESILKRIRESNSSCSRKELERAENKTKSQINTALTRLRGHGLIKLAEQGKRSCYVILDEPA